jgi:hypothetical protein
MATYNQDGILIPDIQLVQAPPGYTSPSSPGMDLPEITVTAPPMLQASLAEWLKPPKVYLLAAGAALVYYLFAGKRR